MSVSTSMRRASTRLVTGLLTATLAVGVFGATGATAAPAYDVDASMILNNVPAADLLANTHGICNGTFTIVIANVGGAAGALRYLDAAQRCGLKAVIHFSTTTTDTGTVYPSRVAPLVSAVKNHPALYGYLTVKEPSWTHISATEIRSIYSAFHRADPGHPVVALFGDIPHFGGTANPYTAGMADIVAVDWYPVETASNGCSRSGTTYVPYGPKWYSTKVYPTVHSKTPSAPIWVMVQTHKYLAPSCHKKQRPTWTQLVREVKEALVFAHASGIAYHTFSNVNYNSDLRRDGTMVTEIQTLTRAVRRGSL